MTGRRCTAPCADGSPCRAWAVHGTDPPRCSAHRGSGRWGAPAGNRNALKHGYYAAPTLEDGCTIDAIIDNLYQRQLQLDDYIDQVLPDATIKEVSHLLRIHGQNASRLGRLLRDRRALSGDAADGISGAIAQALDELSNELGADLT
jgi:glucans biosynthesis protein